MSAVNHNGPTELRALGPIAWEDLGDLLDPLSDAERRDVRNFLAMVTRALAVRSDDLGGLRVRLDSVIAGLIGVVDAIDADCDLEDGDDAEVVCEDEGA